MMLSFILVLVAVALLFLLLYMEGGHNSSVKSLEDLAGQTKPVDIEAFRNLMDPREEDFLRANLLPRDFRAIQRERLRAATEYIGNTAHNAAFLLRLGEDAARSADPRVAQAGRELIDSAVRLRAYALLSVAKLYLRMALPEARLSYGQLVDNYQHLSGLARQLAIIQHPTHAGRLSALL
jgi:hypothetical protein